MILVIGKENCSNCEALVTYLENEDIKFTYNKFEDLLQDEQLELKKKARLNKVMSFPLIIKDNVMMSEKDLRENISLKITKRNGKEVLFDENRIINAISNAMFEVEDVDNELSVKIAKEIKREIGNKDNVESIQDLIENKLTINNKKEVASRYSDFRSKKNIERKKKELLNKNNKLLSEEFLSKYKHIKPPFTPLGEFTYYRTYSRWIPELNRRECWLETIQRVIEYNCSLLPTTKEEAEELFDNMFNLRQFPSGRSLWIAGTKSSEDFPLANYNCSGVVIDSFKKFGELFHALLVGAGVGFRVLFEDVEKLPSVRNNIELIHKEYKPVSKKSRNEYTSLKYRKNKVEITVGDSKIGWIRALDYLLDFVSNNDYKYVDTIIFNYNHVRPLGERLNTFGGFSSGHTSLKNMLEKINTIINNSVNNGDKKLKPIDCMDIANTIAENVVVGGVRRSAEACLFDTSDEEITKAKNNLYTEVDGKWIVDKNIQHRKMSNNSILYYEKPTRERWHWQIEQMRYSGEPAFANMEQALKRNPNGKIFNPCFEIILDDRQSCNLTVVNMMAFVNEDGTFNKELLFKAQRLSARIGYRMTAVNIEMYEWEKAQHRDRLLGCDLTGQQDFRNATKMSDDEYFELMRELKEHARNSMKEIAKENNMNESLLVTAGKPNGTLALLPTVSAGGHWSHSPWYIRRIRVSAQDPLCKVIKELGYPMLPEVGQTLENCDTMVVEFPVKSPVGKTKYEVGAVEQLEYYKSLMKTYVEMNQSITVHVRNNEWDLVEAWVYDNWDDVVAVSFLSLDDNYYQLLPYEAITEEEYNKRVSVMKPFNSNLINKYETSQFEAEAVEDAECTGGCSVR